MADNPGPGTIVPFYRLPSSTGLDVSSQDQIGRHQVIIFLAGNVSPEILANLQKYQQNLPIFSELNTVLNVIQASSLKSAQKLALRSGLEIPILADFDHHVAGLFGLSDRQDILPTIFVVNEEGLIQLKYGPEKFPFLPNPLIVVRAIRRMDSAPRPSPVSPSDWMIGPPGASVIMIEYSDYQCPRCIELHRAVAAVQERFAGKVALVHRHLPLRHTHPLAQQAAEAAEAAGAQGKFWQMHNRLFEASGALERDQLLKYAGEIGLDVPRFTRDLDLRTFQAAVDEDFKTAVDLLIKLPPTLFINSVLVEISLTTQKLIDQVQSILEAG